MKNVLCSLFGHEYEVSKNVTYHVKEYRCKRCNSEMTIDGNGKFIPLTPKFKEINSVLNRIHNKRLERGRKILMVNH
ncbi:DUF1660 family phage protein [Winogradskyella alexanderae]|uniref:DUF1660 family phage protein n=1 Tax=Winogradskyella alexanderae TaxID=2877123 RepID=A0ABS7XP41_9FLAO|nr:DUF1660 family phage protein [Winogradskyella alexanderae]MCA0131154.1 DUF1660 family phage protein [Winogradskyella alexanderae]